MLDEVKVCVDAKVNYFDAYFTVPSELQSTVDVFAQDVRSLGETCQDAADFEANFVSSGLSGRFQTILQQCAQKPHKMTKDEKRKSVEITKNILKENKKEIAADMASRAASRISTELRSEMATQSRERMIADGTYAENTIRKNRVDDAVNLGRFFKKIFKK